MTQDELSGLLPGWEQMSEPEARQKCKALDPRYRRAAFQLWWELRVVKGRDWAMPKAKSKKTKKAKAEVKNGD